MPRTKNKDGANLWPAAGLTLVVFGLLIATGLVITFGVIQQLSYIAWERSLQQTEKSLAAEKELVRQTNKLRELFMQYQDSPLAVSEEQIQTEITARRESITSQLPDNPDTVAEILNDWSINQVPSELVTQLESTSTETFTVVEYITAKQGWNLYIVRTAQGETVDLYTKNTYQRDQTVTNTLYSFENIAFEKPMQ